MPIGGGPGQHAIPSPMRAMPATRATGMATPLKQQLNDERWRDHERKAGHGLSNGGDDEHFLHRRPFMPGSR